MNPVLRAELRHRLGSPRALTLHTVFLSVMALLTFLSLPPELGRLDELRQEGLLLAFLVVATVMTMYFTSAVGCAEIAIEGEKSVWDLAASPFRPQTIAWGKVVSSATFAAIQMLLAGPFMAVAIGIRGEAATVVLRAGVVAVAAATASGALGTLYGAGLDSDFARSFAHWTTLLALIVGANALPSPWSVLSPVRALAITARDGLVPAVWLAVAVYLAIAAVCLLAITVRVEHIRREAAAR